MSNPLEAAYFSAVMVAGALTKASHAKAAEALKLKEAIAKAITHPDTLTDPAFTKPWGKRKDFANLKLDGETGELVTKHAQLLTDTNLNQL